jgi:hypothetical protein
LHRVMGRNAAAVVRQWPDQTISSKRRNDQMLCSCSDCFGPHSVQTPAGSMLHQSKQWPSQYFYLYIQRIHGELTAAMGDVLHTSGMQPDQTKKHACWLIKPQQKLLTTIHECCSKPRDLQGSICHVPTTCSQPSSPGRLCPGPCWRLLSS